jgi:hypothetical protein
MKATSNSRNSIDTQFNGITALTVRVTSTRLGSRGWRLSDTTHGKAVHRTRRRHAVTTNMPKVERVLPILSDEEQERIARALALSEREREFRATLPSVHIDAND